VKRCAIYTRKSTEEGLDQDFNSLDAQHQSCAAYVASQAGSGWKLVAKRYDDGGFSGGTMDRPALQRLLDDINAAKVDIVVVYKIDRLTRSLMDFAKMVDVFDDHGVSFVSVTQAFNTTTSMGRLTLNVLLSFAQFEREVTAERIRDKIAASKKKGMWMGGPSPLGYDVRDKRLIVNETEAEQVRRIFDLYLKVGSVRRLKEMLDEERIVTKRRKSRDRKACGGKPFLRGNLYQLLANPIYIGRTPHKFETFPGLHKAIVDQETWDTVQALRSSHAANRGAPCNTNSPSLLIGLVYDETGDRLSPSHAVKAGVRYRYYISHRLMVAPKGEAGGWRLPAKELEGQVLSALCSILGDDLKLTNLLYLDGETPAAHQAIVAGAQRMAASLKIAPTTDQTNLLKEFVHRIEIHPDRFIIRIDRLKLASMLAGDLVDVSRTNTDVIATLDLPQKLKRRGVEAKIVLGESGSRAPHPDQTLIALVASAHCWLEKIGTGGAASITDLAAQDNLDRNEISRFLPLAFLAPDIVEAVLAGTQPIDLTIKKLRRMASLPYAWDEQRSLLGFAG
jgi:DNA invertase Pin-like site-specific DNA recombinase